MDCQEGSWAVTAISGDFVTVQHVPTRKCWKLTIEVDEANIAQVFQVLGYPTSGESISVGIARLTHAPKAEKPKRHFNDMRPSQQAALKCRDAEFQRFLRDSYTETWREVDAGDEHEIGERAELTATATLKTILDIASRTELDLHKEDAEHWDQLLGSFEAWKRGVAA